MLNLRTEEIIKAVSGKLVSGKRKSTIGRFSTDTRTIDKGDFFIPLIGESFDGHKYIDEAVRKGASGYITAGKFHEGNKDITIIKVRNTNRAFLDIAAAYRKKFRIPFIAVTGSVGKTGTKDMITAVLSGKYKVLSTKGNFNNEVGVPKTLLNLNNKHQAAIIEMGMNSAGEISRLSKTVKPDISVITNIGISHIGNFNSKNDILKAKLEILDGMSRKGTLLMGGDDSLLMGLKGLLKQKTIYCGIDEGMEYRAVRIVKNSRNSMEFDVNIRGTEHTFTVNALGIHNVKNALLAIAVGDIYDIKAEEMVSALKKYNSSRMRLAIREFKDLTVIDDTYNSSPDSVKAAIDVLKDVDNDGVKIAVLGDMLELGDYSGEAHYHIGEYAAKNKIDMVFAYGKFSDYILKGASEKGMANNQLFGYNDMDKLIQELGKVINKDDCILIKGSRGRKMEKIIDILWGGAYDK